MLVTMKGRKSSASKFDRKEFDQRTLSAAVNLIVYGCHVQKYNKSNRKPISRLYYLYEEDMDYLQYLHAGRPFAQCRIPLLDIIELREIPTTESFQNLPYQRTLQITFASKKHTILFDTKDQRDLFWQGLQYFIDVAEHNLIRDIKSTNDNPIVEQITLKQIKGMLPSLSITKQELKNLFNQYDIERRGYISSSNYQDLLKRLMNQDFVRFLFDRYAAQQMNKQEFIKFLANEQSPYQKQCEDAFRLFAKQEGNNFSLSFLEFLNYLLSTYNQLFDYQKTQIYQSEDFPLTDYWINSSHNTYLMGDQLTSESSIQAYINAFQKGCRCVELDCWDGDNNQPIIYHGFTMTSKISFESVIQTIKEYGFKYSKYPLILSLEVHCCLKQQDVMADILKTYLNENILLLPDDYKSSEYYPKLNKLYYKVIIKHRGQMKSSLQYRERFISISPINIIPPAFEESDSPDVIKRPSICLQGEQLQNTPTTLIPRSQKSFKRQDHGLPLNQYRNTINPFQIEEEKIPNKVIHNTKTETTLKPKYKISNIETQFQFEAPNPRCQLVQTPLKVDSDEDIDKAKKEKAESLKMSSITALFGAAIKQQTRTVWEISSLDESKVNENLLDFHRKYFTRIYPSGSRVDSSNYDPIPAFNSGSQIVALNFQTNDMPMLLNMCKFMENGGIESGYVLKPQWMRSDGKKKISEFTTIQMSFTLSLLVGYNLRQLNDQNAKVNPQIKISIRGLQLDECNNKPQVATISQNGLNPQFNFIYKYNIRCPDLAFLIFEVLDASKTFLGWSAIPLSCISYGYRAVQLLKLPLGSPLKALIETFIINMFNNIKRNLTIFNKDIVETSWLKSLIDDVPKAKHVQILHKCLSGEYTNVDPKAALRKISQRLQHSQKPLIALKSLYLSHVLNKFLITQLTEQIIDHKSKDPADVLIASVAQLYYSYLTSQKNAFDRIDCIFKMRRQLEVLILKTNIPILKEIITLLIADIIAIYESIDVKDDYEKRIRAMKQVRRFIDLKGYLQMNQELQKKLNALNFSEIKQQHQIENKICKTIPISQEVEIHHHIEQNYKQLSIQVNESTQFENFSSSKVHPQERKMSLQTGTITNQKGIIQSNTTRASSIKNNFFVLKQGPLSFLIPS